MGHRADRSGMPVKIYVLVSEGERAESWTEKERTLWQYLNGGREAARVHCAEEAKCEFMESRPAEGSESREGSLGTHGPLASCYRVCHSHQNTLHSLFLLTDLLLNSFLKSESEQITFYKIHTLFRVCEMFIFLKADLLTMK